MIHIIIHTLGGVFLETVYLTKSQFQSLKEEIKEIEEVKIPSNTKALEQAKEFGDLSENAEYQAAKETHEKLFRKLNELTNKLNRAEIIQGKSDKTRADIGHRIELISLDTGDTFSFDLIAESGDGINTIDTETKLGSSVLHKSKDDVISFESNDSNLGTLRYKINKIS